MSYTKKCKVCNLTKQLNKFNLRNAKRTKTCSSCLNKNRLSRLKKKNKIDKNQLKLKVVKSLKRTVLPPTIYSVCKKYLSEELSEKGKMSDKQIDKFILKSWSDPETHDELYEKYLMTAYEELFAYYRENLIV